MLVLAQIVHLLNDKVIAAYCLKLFCCAILHAYFNDGIMALRNYADFLFHLNYSLLPKFELKVFFVLGLTYFVVIQIYK